MEAIGRLAGGVAHDFNNLLSVLMISAEFLKDAVQEDEESLEDVKSILETAQRGKQLTNQLLALSRRQPLSPGARAQYTYSRHTRSFSASAG